MNDFYDPDFRQDPQQDPQSGPSAPRPYSPGSAAGGASLAGAAFILSLIAAFSLMIIYVAVPLGALAIILALLSRGRGEITGRAKTALIISLAAVIGSSLITGYSFYRVWSDPQMKARFDRFLNYYLTYYTESDGAAGSVPADNAPAGTVPGSGGGTDILPGSDARTDLLPGFAAGEAGVQPGGKAGGGSGNNGNGMHHGSYT